MSEPKTNYEWTKEKIIQLRLKVIFEVLMIVLGLIFVFMSVNAFVTIMPMDQFLASKEELFAQYEEIKKQDEQIKKLAYYDSLTNLPNHIGFCNHIEEH